MPQGLFGGLFAKSRQASQRVPDPVQAAVPAPMPQPSLIGGGYSPANRKLNGVQTFGRALSALGGDIDGFDKITGSRWDKQDADYKQQQMLEQLQRQRAEVVSLFGPAAGIAFDTNPEKFGEYVGSNYQAANVSGGESRIFGNGRKTYTAPKYSMDGGFGIEQGPGGFRVQGQRGPSFGEQNDAFTADTGRMNADETARNNNMVNSLGRDRLAIDRAKADREAQQAASGGAVFEGPQLAAIYNKSMADLDEVKARQGDLDTIAGASTQFMDVVKDDDWLQGGGWFNDAMQMGSTRTSEAKKLTDTIVPLIRRPGSGSNSDADVKMFKNSVVNVNNTPQSNRLATEQAKALQQRGQQYVDFMTRAIDPRDPQSKQKADALWNKYKAEQSLFDPQTGAVRQVMPFDQWQSKDDVSDLLEKYK